MTAGKSYEIWGLPTGDSRWELCDTADDSPARFPSEREARQALAELARADRWERFWLVANGQPLRQFDRETARRPGRPIEER